MGFFRFCATHWITLLVHCGGASPTMTSVSNSIISCFTPRVSLSRASQCTVGKSGIGCCTCNSSTSEWVIPPQSILDWNSVIRAWDTPGTFIGAALGVMLSFIASPSKKLEGNSGSTSTCSIV